VIGVHSATIPLRVEVTGQVTPVAQALLSSKLQGTVQDLRVREGTAVSKGQVLVKLDNRDLTASLARADAELENARLHLDRMRRLFREESVAKQELDEAARAFKVAKAGRQAVLAQLSYTILRAPFDAVVTEKRIETGELASSGQPLLRVEDPRNLRLEATVAEGDLKALTPGDRIPVIIDALDGRSLVGTVAQILPTGDPSTHTFLVKVALPQTEGLKTGMFGRMQFEKGQRHPLVVPKSAVIERDNLTGVFVVGTDGMARLRWIKIGGSFDQQVEVLSGLHVDDRILAEGEAGIDGARVETVTGER
jgi:RND family efflux transporter MFP subunit